MKAYMRRSYMKELPRGIQKFLFEIKDAFHTIFGNNLFGIYLYGSLSYNAFDPGRSDIDGVVVTWKKLSKKEIANIRSWYAKLSCANQLAKRMEFSFVQNNNLFTDGMTISRAPQLWNGRLYIRKDSDGNNPIVWKNIRDCGIALYGPAPKTFVPPVPKDLIVRSQMTELAFIARKAEQWMKIPANRLYIVTTLCRIAYTLKKYRLAPKKTALAWCRRTFPQKWHPLIAQALEALDKNNGKPAILQKDAVRDFVHFALRYHKA